jgi:formylglycine-generating enzyme required for sulfatase activity
MNEPTIHTDGGAAVAGGVAAGTFIGRDQVFVLSGYSGEDLERVLVMLREVLGGGGAELCADVAHGRLIVTAPGGPPIELSSDAARDLLPVAARRADEGAYLAALLVNPRYGRWASQFVPLAGTLTVFERPPGWSDVPPEFTLLEISGEGPGRGVRRVRLETITEATAQHEALVVLGEPGAGKTTTLYRLALDAARQRLTTGEGKLPLFLSLADYRGYATPQEFVAAAWRQFLGGDGQEAGERLRRGDLLLLCDALNEMPFDDDRDYRARVGAWRRFVGDWPGNQVLFTCRSRDYGEPLGLHQVEIERLDDARVQEFLGKYLEPLSPELAGEAWAQLADGPLLDLVRNPYYLSILAYIVAEGGAWPEGRAALLRGFVELLLGREATRNHPDWPGSEPLQAALSALAEAVQPLGEGTRLPRREMLARIPGRVEGRDGAVETPPVTVLRLGLAATLLDTELAPGGEEQVRFYHHQLQEYFAARALLARFRAGENGSTGLADRWRQPRLAREMPDPGPLGDFEPLPPPPTTGWEEPTVLAAALAPDPEAMVEAVRQANPALAARCLAESGMARPAALVETVQAELVHEMGDEGVHLRARIAAGEALGDLGDLRFRKVEVEGQRALLAPLVYVPAGPFRMGSSAWRVWRLTRRGFPAGDERPRHAVDLPAFLIGRFPVTNAEYACFVEAGGYREERYWPGAARPWLRGEAVESEALKQWMDVWRAVREDRSLLDGLRRRGLAPRQVAAWEQLSQMREGEVRELLGKQYADRPRDRPAFWDDERYDNKAQPVVGVNWWEAVAYCAWLAEQVGKCGNGQMGKWEVWRDGRPGTLAGLVGGERQTLPASWSPAVCLPSEAEWEKAARGTRGWVYPWGNRWDDRRANTWEGHVARPSPVGVYPGGATPEGAHDLSGNVWEWTRSLYQPYPYQAGDGREDPEAEGHRVLRGGSWLSDLRHARCAFRGWLSPVSYSNDVGFRVVVSLASSAF